MLSIGALGLDVIHSVARTLHTLIGKPVLPAINRCKEDFICILFGSLLVGGHLDVKTFNAGSVDVRSRAAPAHFRQGTDDDASHNLDMTECHGQVGATTDFFDQDSTDDGDNNDDPRKAEYN